MLKQLEGYWRRLWIRLLTSSMRRPATATPNWSARPHRLLFLRHDRIGDMILSTAVMRAIAESHPGIELDVLASPGNARVLDGAAYVRKIIVFDKRDPQGFGATAKRLRQEQYDAVIDCMVTAPSVTTLLLMRATNAPYRVGISGRGTADGAINVAVPPAGGEQHMAIELSALTAAFGIDPASRSWKPELHMTPANREAAAARWRSARAGNGQRVLVNVSASVASRQWPVEKFAAVITHLRRRLPDSIVIVTGAPDQWDRITDVAQRGAATPVDVSLPDVFALVATADLVVTPNTSIAHVASAFDRPTVALYQKGESLRWGLHPGVGENVENSDDSLLTLDVEPVLAAIDRLLASRG